MIDPFLELSPVSLRADSAVPAFPHGIPYTKLKIDPFTGAHACHQQTIAHYPLISVALPRRESNSDIEHNATANIDVAQITTRTINTEPSTLPCALDIS